QITWEVANLGPGIAEGSWVDRVYVSNDGQVGNDTLLESFTHTGNVAEGEHYTRTETVTVPELSDGAYWVIVLTDATNTVYENQNEGNNATISQQTIAIVHPDLQVTELNVPVDTTSGATLAVSWTVMNTGSGVTNVTSWKDGIYISQNQVLDASDTLLGEFARTSQLASSTAYQADLTVTIPNGISGAYYVLVVADHLNEVKETGAEGN